MTETGMQLILPALSGKMLKGLFIPLSGLFLYMKALSRNNGMTRPTCIFTGQM